MSDSGTIKHRKPHGWHGRERRWEEERGRSCAKGWCPLDLRLASREVCVITFDIVVRAENAELYNRSRKWHRFRDTHCWDPVHPWWTDFQLRSFVYLLEDSTPSGRGRVFARSRRDRGCRTFSVPSDWPSPLETLFRSGVPLKASNLLLKSDPTPDPETAPRPTGSLFSSDGRCCSWVA